MSDKTLESAWPVLVDSVNKTSIDGKSDQNEIFVVESCVNDFRNPFPLEGDDMEQIRFKMFVDQHQETGKGLYSIVGKRVKSVRFGFKNSIPGKFNCRDGSSFIGWEIIVEQ